jgi:hypothetical protein
MENRLRIIKKRLQMCFDVLCKPSVLLVTTTDLKELQAIEVKSVNITNNDTLQITTAIRSFAIAERNHFKAVDNFVNNLIHG